MSSHFWIAIFFFYEDFQVQLYGKSFILPHKSSYPSLILPPLRTPFPPHPQPHSKSKRNCAIHSSLIFAYKREVGAKTFIESYISVISVLFGVL